MGNCTEKEKLEKNSTYTISKHTFNIINVIGKGGFGKVWKVQHKKNKEKFAMKEMQKAKIISKRSVNSVMNEKEILQTLKHPFIINMKHSFQDRENLYLIMDLLRGGDFRYHICQHRKFTESQTRFIIACLVHGLEFVHNAGIIHRDIKPENLVFDDLGYVRITDFGIARIWKPENNMDTSGTPGYMAPEVMCKQNHGVSVDYYAVGIIAYECMMGRRPYLGRSRKEIRDQILAKQVQIKKQDIPDNWSKEAADFTNRLIQRKPINRLGMCGPEEVKGHPWLKSFPWDKLHNKQITPPFIPKQDQDNFDNRMMQNTEELTPNEKQQNQIMMRRNSIQNMFLGYNADKVEITNEINNKQQNNNSLSTKNSTSNNIKYQTSINTDPTKK